MSPKARTDPGVHTVDISLNDVDDNRPPKREAPPPRTGLPITLRLDEPDDIDTAQVKFLEREVLSCRDNVSDQTFRFRFRYDLHGTAHWHGDWFILDVLNGECALRLAGRGDFDGSVGQMYKSDKAANLREGIAVRHKHAEDLAKGRRTVGSPRGYSLVLDVPWRSLSAKDLKHALDLFRVAEVMIS